MQELAVSLRTLQGKKVKSLKKEGLVPAVIYGKHMKSPISISLNKNDFLRTYRKGGTSTAITLKGDKINELVLISDIQLDPVSDFVVHVDFHAVKADEKVTAEVPVVLVGTPIVEKNNEGRVQAILSTIEVEAFPQDLPHDISIDVSHMEHIHDVIFVKDLKFSDKVTVMIDPEQPVVTVVTFSDEEIDNTAPTAEDLAGAAAATDAAAPAGEAKKE